MGLILSCLDSLSHFGFSKHVLEKQSFCMVQDLKSFCGLENFSNIQHTYSCSRKESILSMWDIFLTSRIYYSHFQRGLGLVTSMSWHLTRGQKLGFFSSFRPKTYGCITQLQKLGFSAQHPHVWLYIFSKSFIFSEIRKINLLSFVIYIFQSMLLHVQSFFIFLLNNKIE